MVSRLKTFGFEIEGEFSETLEEALKYYGIIKGDGSISTCDQCSDDGLIAREFNSVVYYNTKAGMYEAREIFEQLEDGFHFNKTMGFHVHLGFSPKRPPELFYTKFFKELSKALENEFPDEYRARSRNRYCKFLPKATLGSDSYAYQGDGDRYKAINLHCSMDLHGTLEIRFFPTAEPKKMLKYLEFCLSFVGEFINRGFDEFLVINKTSLFPKKNTKVADKIIKFNQYV